MSGHLSSFLQYSKLKRIPVSLDGNSFYRAISQAYYKNQDFHLLLRKTIVEDILHNTSIYRQYISTSDTELLAARQKGVWNPLLEKLLAFAVSEHLKIHLVIYSIQKDESLLNHVYSPEKYSQKIQLLEHNQHYELLLHI
jgi:hypothetical protein